MINLNKIYNASPVLLQQVMANASGYVKAHQRYGTTYKQHREWLQDFDTWSLDRAYDFQAKTLREFVSYATEFSPFYKDLYSNCEYSKVKSPHDLDLLPIVEKDLLREKIANVHTIASRKAIQSHTGGTTGKSIVVRFTRDDFMRRMAMLDHFKSRHGFENRMMRKATFSGKRIIPKSVNTDIYWRYNAASKQMLYSTFDLSERNLHAYVEHLNDFKPHALEGYFTSLCDIASFVERKEISLSFQPIGIFTTSEPVTESGKELLERVFKTRVYDQYASNEGAPFVTECSYGSMHVELSTGVFENLSGSDEITITSFTTHGTPLIRYRIGDTMTFGDTGSRCDCGLSGPIILNIGGRTDDYLLRIDGSKINGVQVAGLLKYMPDSLIQAQMVQEKVGHLTVLLSVDQSAYELKYDDLLRKQLDEVFGDKTEFNVIHVPEITREASGKLRLIKNTIKNPPVS